MPGKDPLSLILVIVLAASIAYRSSFLKNKRLFRISLIQILYLVIVPGIVFVFFYNYLQYFSLLPASPHTLASDSVLVPIILLSALFTYGGIAIHTASKTLSDTSLRGDESDAAELNRYFHLTFSHNLIYGGSITLFTGLVLLELNHTSTYEYTKLLNPIIRGILIGGSFLFSMYNYTKSDDDYSGRWADLKAVFAIGWLASVLILYEVVKIEPTFRDYQLLLPALLGFSLINIFNLGLVVRHIRRKRAATSSR